MTWWCWLWACTRSRSLPPSLPPSFPLFLFVQTCTHIPGVGGRSHHRFLHRIRLVRLAVRARFLLLGQHLAQRQELVALRRYDWARADARVCAQAICTQGQDLTAWSLRQVRAAPRAFTAGAAESRPHTPDMRGTLADARRVFQLPVEPGEGRAQEF